MGAPREYLNMVGTIHRLESELMPLARSYVEEIVPKFVPMAARLVELFFRNVRYLNFLISTLLYELPDVVVEKVADESAAWRPQGKSGTHKVRKHEKVELAAKPFVIASRRLFALTFGHTG